MTGPNSVDRGRSGAKIHVLSDCDGVPLSVAVSAANANDSCALKPLIQAIPAIRELSGTTPDARTVPSWRREQTKPGQGSAILVRT